LEGRLGWLSGPELGRPAGAFLRGNPSTDEVFPNEPAFQLDEQPDYLYGEAVLTADTRDEPGYPTRGGIYRAAWTRYSDREAERFSFQRYEAEATHFVPLNHNIGLALHGWIVGTSPADGHDVPFYLMPGLGGNNTMRGYADYRFHDRHLAVVNVETRVAIFEHIDAVGFVDAGNVAARWSDLNFKRRSYGAGVRVHGQDATYARLEFARSAEGWHVVFRMNDPFGYSRLRKRGAQAPFAP
jgi:outer membrane protein assembly factor BamA